jgi:hypothetical protein
VRAPLSARPARDALLALPLHVVVRDYPELLAVLRERGVDPGGAGGRSLARILAAREDGEALLSALLTAVEWRPRRTP